MSAPVPCVEPTLIVAGDSYEWNKSVPNYTPADGWTLAYYIRGKVGYNSIAVTTDGNRFHVELSATNSAGFTPDDYRLIGIVSKSGARVKVYDGPLKIMPDPASTTTPYEAKSLNRRILDSLNAVIEGKATHDQLRYSVFGRTIDKLTWDDVLKARDYYAGLVRQEDIKDRIARGESTGKNVLIRFNRP